MKKVKIKEFPSSEVLELGEKWCVVIVQPGHEETACASFKSAGVQCYWPNYMKGEWPKNGPFRFRRLSVIPGMIFIPRSANNQMWAALPFIRAVRCVLRSDGGKIVTLCYGDIETMRRIEADQNKPRARVKHNFKIGQKVRFVADLASTFVGGMITGIAKDGQIMVEVSAMGRMVRFSVLPHQIEGDHLSVVKLPPRPVDGESKRLVSEAPPQSKRAA
jgi:transcription antitermination factor NusG